MKNYFMLVFLAVLFLLPSCSANQEGDQVVRNISTTAQSTMIATQEKTKPNFKQPLTQEEQKQLLTEHLQNCLEKERVDANERFVLGEGDPFDLTIKNAYYSFYDIDGDGVPELIRGYKDEKYFGFIKGEGLGSIIINSISYISDNKAVHNNYSFNVPGSDINGVPVIYSNGIIRDGGKDSENYQEFYYYLDCKGNMIYCLRHLFKTDSNEDKYEIQYYESGNVLSNKIVTKEDFIFKKNELEVEPINAELDWYHIKDII